MDINRIIQEKENEIVQQFRDMEPPLKDEEGFIKSLDHSTILIDVLPSLDRTKIKGLSIHGNRLTTVYYTIYLTGKGSVFKKAMAFLEKKDQMFRCIIDETSNSIKLKFVIRDGEVSGSTADRIKSLFKEWVESAQGLVDTYNSGAVSHNDSVEEKAKRVYSQEIQRVSDFGITYNPFL